MIKKLLAATTLVAASAAFAGADTVAYTFNLDKNTSGSTSINGATNVQICSGEDVSCTSATVNLDGGNAKLVISRNQGKFWDTGSSCYTSETYGVTKLASNATAQEMFTTAGILSTEISKITKGVSNGAAEATTTFAVSGLIADTTYTVTMLVGAFVNSSTTGTAKISWDTGKLVSGRYAYGDSATQTLSASDTSTTLANLSAVELKITTDSNGAFNIKL